MQLARHLVTATLSNVAYAVSLLHARMMHMLVLVYMLAFCMHGLQLLICMQSSWSVCIIVLLHEHDVSLGTLLKVMRQVDQSHTLRLHSLRQDQATRLCTRLDKHVYGHLYVCVWIVHWPVKPDA